MLRIPSLLPAVSIFGVLLPDLVPAYLLSSCRQFRTRLATPSHELFRPTILFAPPSLALHTRSLAQSFGTKAGMAHQAAGQAGHDTGRAVEIEKKFMLADGAEDRVAAVLPFRREVSITDEYLDAADFRLTTNDHWLRVRDGQVELKEPIAVPPGASPGMDRYVELTDPAAIAASLKRFFPTLEGASAPDLRTALEREGCEAFCKIVSLRRQYGGGDGRLAVDLDIVSEPSHINYRIGEVEDREGPIFAGGVACRVVFVQGGAGDGAEGREWGQVMARDESGVPEAEAAVDAFLASHELASNQVALGKVLAVIKDSNAAHWNALKKSLGDKYPKLNKV